MTTAPTEGDGTALAGGEVLGSGAVALAAGLAASTVPGASSKSAGSAQEIIRLSARSRPNEATLAPSTDSASPARDGVLSLLYAVIEVFIHLQMARGLGLGPWPGCHQGTRRRTWRVPPPSPRGPRPPSAGIPRDRRRRRGDREREAAGEQRVPVPGTAPRPAEARERARSPCARVRWPLATVEVAGSKTSGRRPGSIRGWCPGSGPRRRREQWCRLPGRRFRP